MLRTTVKLGRYTISVEEEAATIFWEAVANWRTIERRTRRKLPPGCSYNSFWIDVKVVRDNEEAKYYNLCVIDDEGRLYTYSLGHTTKKGPSLSLYAPYDRCWEFFSYDEDRAYKYLPSRQTPGEGKWVPKDESDEDEGWLEDRQGASPPQDERPEARGGGHHRHPQQSRHPYAPSSS